MNHRRWLNLTLLGLLMLLPSIGQAQWYQGPSGGRGGVPFDNWTRTGGKRKVQELIIKYDTVIRCVMVSYVDGSASSAGSGCSLAPPTIKIGHFGIDLDEFLIGVAGRHGDVIDSIRFFTNKKNSGTYGGSGGTVDFGYTAPSGHRIVAFTGRAGSSVDAIGVLYVPVE